MERWIFAITASAAWALVAYVSDGPTDAMIGAIAAFMISAMYMPK